VPPGFYTDSRRQCICTLPQIQRYKNKLSGPLLDRIDIQVEVPPINFQEISTERLGESSQAIKARVVEARAVQHRCFEGMKIYCNALMTSRQVRQFCRIDDISQGLLRQAIEKLGLSARAYTRIIKVPRTISDLEGEEHIKSHHIAEAIQYRSLDRALV
jgi:magnesium chelatase family protein